MPSPLQSPFPLHAVAVIGGAVAGAEAAGVLAERGILAVVFEQNARPHGKIEDGLPRWHDQQRLSEYSRIAARLTHPLIRFVPMTRIGRDVPFDSLAGEWGFSAVLVASGAWRDRRIPVPEIDRFRGKGLIYQNPFIHWYNHHIETGYAGPRYECPDGAIVVGGGLASIDVAKVFQFENVGRELRRRGIETTLHDLELKGIPEVLKAHGLAYEDLGLKGCTLYYRRRIQDMPLAQPKENATAEDLRQTEHVREKLLNNMLRKYLFNFRPNRVPVAPLADGDVLRGLRFAKTEVREGRVVTLPETEDVPAPLVISSIGSVPLLFPELRGRSEFYEIADPVTGELRNRPNVFALGNAVTGKGNIAVSRKHGRRVALQVVEWYLGLTPELPPGVPGPAAEAADQAGGIAARITGRPPLPAGVVDRIEERVRARQSAVGYGGDLAEWLKQATTTG